MIVPARDAASSLPRTLAALGAQRLDGEYEVIVIDNGSVDETPRLAADSPAVETVITRPRGEGPGAARNAGARAARADVLAFVDADCRPAPDWLAEGLRALKDLDVVQGRVLPDPDAEIGPFDRTLAVNEAHGLFETANLFVRREVFERTGGFPPGLEVGRQGEGRAVSPFGEDVIFGWRARRAGARTGFCETAVVHHEVFGGTFAEFVSERARQALFPALAATVPELREAFFYRRYFMNRRSATLHLAFWSLLLALATGRRSAAALALPYCIAVARVSRPWGLRRAPIVALGQASADVVGAVALIRGSLASGCVVL